MRPAGPNGVVLAQGGDRQGYALHFLDGKAAFDVRIDGKVTRVMMKKRISGLNRLEARLDRKTMSLSVNANIPPISRVGIQKRDLSHTAQTINQRGTTIVPLEVRPMANGDVTIRAKDPDYATAGPDEAQQFLD